MKNKKILIGVLIGLVSFPLITLGGSFTSSLIQGKTVEEAVEILAEQIDVLIGRVDMLENKQSELERQNWCLKMLTLSKRVVGGVERPIEEGVEYYNQYPPSREGVLEETQEQYNLYLEAKEKCDN